MVKVKICGITNLEDALYAVKQGADALGFVFYKKSPRYIKPEKARVIISKLPKFVKKVGVFVNARESTIKRLTRNLKLDMLQFHGDESDDFCRRFRNFKIIKAFRVRKKIHLTDLSKYNVWAYLFDTFARNKFGGTGEKFDWRLLSGLKGLKKTIFLSGGLNPQNIRKALKSFSAHWVDSSSSLEKYPGKKDFRKVKRFIRNAKGLH
jgi:phosphoribosylanthranilate isomerase